MKVKQGVFNRDGLSLESLEIELKGTTIIMLEGYGAFFMCGALDVDIYGSREVVCGRAIGVKTLEQLYNASIAGVSHYTKQLGIDKGMRVFEAFKKLSEKK